MDLKDIQSAIAELDRERKKLINKIAYRERRITEDQEAIKSLKVDLTDRTERWTNLIKEEQKIVRPGSVEE